MASPHDLSSPPTDHVISMQQQGLSNNQIIEYLQRQGYTPEQVFEAMNQASVKGSVENMGQEIFDDNMQQPQQMPPQGPPQQFSQPQQPPMGGMEMPMDMGQSNISENIERIAETIIEEKWNELSKHINKIIDWKEKTEGKINKIELQFDDLKKGFDSLHEALLGKVNEYDQNIIHLGVEIKAMEKVFQKILPTLTDSVSELSRITKGMKKD